MNIRTLLRTLFVFGVAFTASFAGRAQVTVDNSLTVEELVNEVILGDGVNASNITYNGMPGDMIPAHVGTFDATASDFPIGQGMVMATASIGIVNGTGIGIEDPNIQNDPDLLAIAGSAVNTLNNCAIIEFDFTVDSDSVVFDYIFASAEYQSFTCTGFNDVFGFFLSGPGITGPYSSPPGYPDGSTNIALIPNSDVAVGVNTVNGGAPTGSGTVANCLEVNPNFVEDSQYFVNNQTGSNSISTTLNGHTVQFTAREGIICGETYHIKLALANANDQGFQSAVFLREGSFSASGEVFLEVSPSLPGVDLSDSPFADVVVAGCFSPLVELIRPEGAPVGSITVSYGGTATEGVDYLLGENDTLFAFSEGIDTLTYNVQTFSNPNAPDTLTLDFFVIYEVCDGFDTLTATLNIVQPYEFNSETENVDVYCPADSVVVTAEATDGVGPYTFNWIGQSVGQQAFVPVPEDAAWYVVEIIDQCEFEPVFDSVLVTNLIPPPLSLELPQTAEPLCPLMEVTIDAFASDGNGEYIFDWSPVQGDSASASSVTVAFPQTTTMFLTVTDTCGTQVTDSVQVFYPDYDDIQIALDLDRRTCPDSPLSLAAEIIGGAGEYNIVWSEAEQRGNFETPDEAETFYVPEPGFSFLQVDVIDQCFAQGFAGPYVGFLDVSDTLRTIDLEKVPNVITPNNDNRNDYFAVPGLDIFAGTNFQVWDRWGTSVFESNDYRVVIQETGRPSNAFDGADRPDGSYYFILNVNSGECVKTGYVEILGSNEPNVRR